ncbi:MAG: AAA family ATPase [Eubacteriales bacterium]|nr:AAA family ATPase [Eubacteriales bacterium]
MKKKLPVGIENFAEFAEQDFYYVDKTGFIIELLHNWGKVNLFTRPRRFGKSLNMSMLKAFFEIGCDRPLFDGLKITRETELCEAYMGKFPVISITLKGVDGSSFQAARESLRFVIGTEARRFAFLAESEKLTKEQRMSYRALTGVNMDGNYSMSDAALEYSLLTLSSLLEQHYGRKTMIFIDEYDVPLEKAFQGGFYEEMLTVIRKLFDNALKTNDSLQFAVLTGCLRVSKESIFTGLNNPNVMTITDEYFSDSFGFTEQEVKALLEYYGLEDALETVREWYDGYQFGSSALYCPWDVIKYVQALRKNAKAVPENYWANTSGNRMVRRFLEKAQAQTKQEIERLISGESIVKPLNQELTYEELDKSIENLWSVLFTTGYLTARRRVDENRFELAIPNKEIRNLFISQIQEWFQENAREDHSKLDKFCKAFPEAKADMIQELLDEYLWNAISIRDTAVREERKENFYHGLLLGLLQYEGSWRIKSNIESGEGYSDLLIETPDRIGIVIELKYAGNQNLEGQCTEALKQIEQNFYEARLVEDGMDRILKYGIAFYKKRCKVMLG